MKVLSVIGITQSGKTTTVENIIRELTKRGYSVGSVKEIHFEEFEIDTIGSNTDRHRKAGSKLVTARGMAETDVLYQSMLSIDKIISFYDYDYLILEGVKDVNAPKIITAHKTSEVDERRDYSTFVVSGRLADEIKQYDGLSVIHCMDEIVELVDLIEKTVPDLLPDFDEECCGACGYSCHEMLSRIISGKPNECCIRDTKVKLKVEGKNIDMVPFVQNILKNAVLGVVSELEGYDEKSEITVEIER